MENNPAFGEDYKTKFDPHEFLSQYFTSNCYRLEEGGVVPRLHQLFSTMEPSPDGKLLDLGSGPTIHGVLSASRVYKDITLAEYTEANRGALERWLRRDPGAYDWTHFLEFVGGLEGVSSEEIEQRVRHAIKEVIPCDVTHENILLDPDRGPYDFILCTLCLDAACADIEAFRQAIRKIGELLKPGGKFFLMEALGESVYAVRDTTFFCLRLSQADIEGAVKDAGLTLESSSVVRLDSLDDVCDNEGQHFMLASKPQ